MDAQRLAVGSEGHMTLAETMQIADMFVKSGMFSDVKTQAQAFVIIMAGRELGFSATASMMGINVLFGKPSLSADLIAALIKRDKRYSFNIVVHTANECRIEFFEYGKLCHTEIYTIEDAAKAGLVAKDLWKKHPRELLYARCISKGGNIVCPQRMAGVDISEERSAPVETVEATPEAAAQAVEELTGERPPQAIAQNTPDGPALAPVNAIDAMSFQTYTADANVLGRFWGWAKGLGLTEADVHAALNVAHLAYVQGTVGQVRATVQAYADSMPTKALEEELFGDQSQERAGADAEMAGGK